MGLTRNGSERVQEPEDGDVSPDQNGVSGVAYQRIAETLRDAIGRGDYADGRRLPTEAELSAEYSLSRQTVRRALQELVAEGLVYRVRGRGTFASQPGPRGRFVRTVGSVEDLLALSVDTTMQTIEPLVRQFDVDTAGRLQLDTDEVMSCTVIRLSDDVPFCVTRVFLPPELGRRVAELGALREAGEVAPRTVIGLVDEVSPEKIAGAHQSITASSVPAEFAAMIDCRPDDPVIRIDRLYYGTAGALLELAISFFNPNRYTYRLDLSRRIS
jgi:GntR family transcriptional regulator